MNSAKIKHLAASIVVRGLFFSLIWWSLSEGDPASWWVGGPAVLLALFASMALLPPPHLVWYQLLRFIPFFLIRSLLGATDVAWRAFHPRLPIAPVLMSYQLQLPPGLARVIMVNSVSLLPGTLSVAVEQNRLNVHALCEQKNGLAALQQLELRVAQLFRVPLNSANGVK
jgi:multicomponent Na+:H+ antiporter subunit E